MQEKVLEIDDVEWGLRGSVKAEDLRAAFSKKYTSLVKRGAALFSILECALTRSFATVESNTGHWILPRTRVPVEPHCTNTMQPLPERLTVAGAAPGAITGALTLSMQQASGSGGRFASLKVHCGDKARIVAAALTKSHCGEARQIRSSQSAERETKPRTGGASVLPPLLAIREASVVDASASFFALSMASLMLMSRRRASISAVSLAKCATNQEALDLIRWAITDEVVDQSVEELIDVAAATAEGVYGHVRVAACVYCLHLLTW